MLHDIRAMVSVASETKVISNRLVIDTRLLEGAFLSWMNTNWILL